MSSAARYTTALAIGAMAMYWLDPRSGRLRRARLGDRLHSIYCRASREAGTAFRDLAQRARGLKARTRSALDGEHAVPDIVLAERVRAALGRVVSHPGAIDVSVATGRVELSGPVLAQEYAGLMRAVEAVSGVEAVIDRLGVHEEARGIPALQGGRVLRPARFENWTPTARLFAGAAGIGLLACGAICGTRGRAIAAVMSGAAGGALLFRTTTNKPLAMLASGTGDAAIRVHKTLHVDAPLARVFDTLSRFENFRFFMRNVQSVRAESAVRSHWRVRGPAGTTVEWHAETTQFEPNKLIAWRTIPGAMVRHSGTLWFVPMNGGTRLEIELSYSPPAGLVGHTIAKLFGVDPKKEIDEDLLRLKSFLETGKPPRDNAAHIRRLRAPAEPVSAPMRAGVRPAL